MCIRSKVRRRRKCWNCGNVMVMVELVQKSAEGQKCKGVEVKIEKNKTQTLPPGVGKGYFSLAFDIKKRLSIVVLSIFL